jgi:hypothetical protein
LRTRSHMPVSCDNSQGLMLSWGCTASGGAMPFYITTLPHTIHSFFHPEWLTELPVEKWLHIRPWITPPIPINKWLLLHPWYWF